MAAIAGDPDAPFKVAHESLAENPQWAAQLSDHLLALSYKVADVRRLKADALERLGSELLTATGRNYYFTVAKQMRQMTDE